MRRADARPGPRPGLAPLTVGLLAGCLTLAAHAVPAADLPPPEQVQQALQQVQSDPDLGQSKKKQKTLRFKKDQRDAKPPADPNLPDQKKTRQPTWLSGFARWLSEAGRVVVWVLGALAVATVAATAHRWMRARGQARADRRLADLPSHMRELDIRPQSLPERVGDAAQHLWQQGAHREALSLLYRGMLSRLVHDHAVPIRAASTEGECVQLARRHVDATCGQFVGELVQAWQLAVYGARLPEAATVLALCEHFEARLARPVASTAEATA